MRLKAGEVLFIPAGVKHGAKDVGGGKGSELATYIVEKGKPLVHDERRYPKHASVRATSRRRVDSGLNGWRGGMRKGIPCLEAVRAQYR